MYGKISDIKFRINFAVCQVQLRYLKFTRVVSRTHDKRTVFIPLSG